MSSAMFLSCSLQTTVGLNALAFYITRLFALEQTGLHIKTGTGRNNDKNIYWAKHIKGQKPGPKHWSMSTTIT